MQLQQRPVFSVGGSRFYAGFLCNTITSNAAKNTTKVLWIGTAEQAAGLPVRSPVPSVRVSFGKNNEHRKLRVKENEKQTKGSTVFMLS